LRRWSLARLDGRYRLGPMEHSGPSLASATVSSTSSPGSCCRGIATRYDMLRRHCLEVALRELAVQRPACLRAACKSRAMPLRAMRSVGDKMGHGWAQKGRLLPHEAPFRFQRWLQTAYKSPRSKIAAPGLLFCCYVGVRFERDERTGERHQREIRWACSQIGAGVRSTSMWRPTVSLVALCVAHVGVPFEGGEYLGRGAAVHDPIEGGASVRQPGVEPSNKLQPVPSSHLLLGTLRLRGTKDCNDLTRFCRRRSEAPLQVHRVLCGYQAPNTNQQRGYRKR